MKKTISKITSIALTASTVAWIASASFAPLAFAESAAEVGQLQALIAQLTSQLSTLQGGATTTTAMTGSSMWPAGIPAGFRFTKTLTLGARSEEATNLQRFLNAVNPALALPTTGYFGPMTKKAVIWYQDANASDVLAPAGLSKGTGFWGSLSRAKANSTLASWEMPVVTTPSTTTTTTTTTPTTTTTTTTTSTPVGQGSTVDGLMVSLDARTPVSSNVPKGAAGIPFLSIAISGNSTLNALTFKRVGLGSSADFATVNLYDGGYRLTSGRSVNSTTNEVSFTGLNWKIMGSKTLTLVADISSSVSSGNIDAFNLVAVNGTTLAMPINGNSMAFAGSTVGGITVTMTGNGSSNGSISNPTVGQTSAQLGEFKLQANSVEDLWVKRVVLYNVGTINSSNLNNLMLKQAGTLVAKSAGTAGRDLFVFDFDQPYSLLKGQQRTFQVYGDVGALARASETIKFTVDNTSDVFATGATYGYGAAVTNSASASVANVLTLRGAEVTLSFNGPITRDIAQRAQNVTLFDFSIASKNNIEVKKLNFVVDLANMNTTSAEGLDNFKVVDAMTGAAVTSSVDLQHGVATTVGGAALTPNGNSSNTFSFNDSINVAAGETRKFLVTANVNSLVAGGNETAKVTLGTFGSTDIKNLDNNQFVAVSTDLVPNSTIVGNVQSVKTVGLTVSLNASPASHTIVKGSVNEPLLGLNFQATNGEVRINNMTLTADASTGTDAQLRNDLRTLGIYGSNGSLVGNSTKQNLTSSSSVSVATFNNLNLVIPNGQTVTVWVKADQISTDATTSNVYFVYLADMSADISATDVDGNNLTLSGSVNATPTSAVTVNAPLIQVVAVNDQDTEAAIVAANGERLLAKFDFFATNSDSQVNKLQVGLDDDSTAGTDPSATPLAALTKAVREIRLYSGDTLIATGIPAASGSDAGTFRFENANGLFTVPANQTKQIQVRGLLGDITGVTGSATTGTSIFAKIASANFESVSGTTKLTTLTNTPVIGSLKRMYRTIPTVTVSNPSSSVLTVGENEVLKFTIAADQNGDLDVSKVAFNVSASTSVTIGNTDADMKVRTASGDVSLDAATDISATTGAITVGAVFATPERIAAGTSKTYSLYLTVSAVPAGSGSLSARVARAETDIVTPAAVSGLYAANSFVWSDRGVQPHTTSTADWHNGFYVKTLPSSTKALSKS